MANMKRAECKRGDDGEASELDTALEDLPARERTFILALVDGLSPEDSARKAGFSESRSDLAAARLLGKPRVSRAIARVLPFLPDTSRALRLLAPAAIARLVRVLEKGSDAQAVSIAKEVLERSEGHSGAAKRGKPIDGAAMIRDALARREARTLAQDGRESTPADDASTDP